MQQKTVILRREDAQLKAALRELLLQLFARTASE